MIWVVVALAAAYGPLVLRMSLIFYVLNADSGRYADALVSWLHPWNRHSLLLNFSFNLLLRFFRLQLFQRQQRDAQLVLLKQDM